MRKQREGGKIEKRSGDLFTRESRLNITESIQASFRSLLPLYILGRGNGTSIFKGADHSARTAVRRMKHAWRESESPSCLQI